jgi:hypothetical protein
MFMRIKKLEYGTHYRTNSEKVLSIVLKNNAMLNCNGAREASWRCPMLYGGPKKMLP